MELTTEQLEAAQTFLHGLKKLEAETGMTLKASFQVVPLPKQEEKKA